MSLGRSQMNSRDPQYYETRNLSSVTWQEIFYRASHIPLRDEFTTNPRAYNILPCGQRGYKEDSHTIPWELTNAISTRLSIVLVCKSWHAMGLEVLYSHVRVFESFLRKMTFYRLLTANPQLLLFTRRLTIDPGGWRRTFFKEPAWEPAYRASWLCSSLPNLQILEAPWQLFSLFPFADLPPRLEVVIFHKFWSLRMDLADTPKLLFPTAWRHIRVMSFHIVHLAHCARKPSSAVLFTSLEDLQVSEALNRGDPNNLTVIRHISNNWTAPRLHTLSIDDITWLDWMPFLQRHAGNLRVLDLPTHDTLERYENWQPTKDRSMLIEFPQLRELYLPYGKNIPYVIAKQLQRVGVHNLGCSGPGQSDGHANRPGHLDRLLEIFRFWHRYNSATTYCIHGWHGDTLWLKEQPKVAQYIRTIEQSGKKVEWMHFGCSGELTNMD